tara:strand:+ start:4936 stop:6036 length:1101 start_codon:yes stop_codon:yes gene_type:complete
MENQKTEEKSVFDIDTFEVLKILNRSRRTLIFFVLIFLFLGIIVSILSSKEYTSSTTFIAQFSTEKKIGKKISGIASMMGINVGGGESNSILPMHYPLIVESTPFKKELLKTKIPVKNSDSSVTISYYLTNMKETSSLSVIKSYTLGLPGKVLGLFESSASKEVIKAEDSTSFYLNSYENNQIGYLYSHFSVNINDVDGFIEISTTFPEAEASAKLANNIQDLLQEFIIKYNIKKGKQELEYIKDRFKEAEKDYFSKRAALANYKDRNVNVISNLAQNRLEQLQTEYSLSSNIYSQLAGELETAKLNVKKDTPVFTVIKPATIPIEPSSPKRVLILLQFILVGFLIGAFYILFRHFYPLLKNKIAN